MAALLLYVDFRSVVTHATRVDSSWAIFSAALILTSTLIGAYNIYIFIRRDHSLCWISFLAIYWVGWALSLIVPGQVGDIAGISTLLRKHDVPWQVSIARSLLDKILSMLVMLSLAIGGLLLVAQHIDMVFAPPALSLPATIVFTFAIGFSIYLLRGHSHQWVERLRRFAVNAWTEILRTCKAVPKLVLLNFLLTIAKTLLVGLSYWCMFRAFGQSPAPGAVVLLSAASSLVAYIPVSLNGLGTVELAGIALFATLGLPAPVVLAAYLLLRGMVLALAWLPAGAWLLLARR